MLNKVKSFIQQHGLISSGDRVIAAVSGGPDSMAMLLVLADLSKELNFFLVAAHLNHMIREEAGAEEEFIKETCYKLNLPVYTRVINVPAEAARQKKSLEEAGRDCRYSFFHELRQEISANRIAVAHHQDDVAETVLLHLLRGSGIKGLRGILPAQGVIIRPLLGVRKEDILLYMKENSWPYCLDQSNQDTYYLRNRIRHQLMPYLKENYNPRIVDGLNHLAEIAREENDFLEMEAEKLWQQAVIETTPDSIIMAADLCHKLHPALRNRIFLKAAEILRAQAGWSISDIKAIRNLGKQPGSSKEIHLKKGLRVKKVYNRIIFTIKQEPDRVFFCYKVPIPGALFIPETGDTFSFSVHEGLEKKSLPAEMVLDYDRLDFPLFVRSKKEGDIFRPAGFKGRKKLQDFFIDIKLPAAERDKVPLLASRDTIFAVLKYRLAENAAVKPYTKRFLVIDRVQ
ncbi:MAG: tRNA lysidine(34) synthetase TilS [Syntrophomonadaceae bacterium]|jgi:tRNA(Ile)-lysidine synthase